MRDFYDDFIDSIAEKLTEYQERSVRSASHRVQAAADIYMSISDAMQKVSDTRTLRPSQNLLPKTITASLEVEGYRKPLMFGDELVNLGSLYSDAIQREMDNSQKSFQQLLSEYEIADDFKSYQKNLEVIRKAELEAKTAG